MDQNIPFYPEKMQCPDKTAVESAEIESMVVDQVSEVPIPPAQVQKEEVQVLPLGTVLIFLN